jgi:hypothetical protein
MTLSEVTVSVLSSGVDLVVLPVGVTERHFLEFNLFAFPPGNLTALEVPPLTDRRQPQRSGQL